MENEELSRKKLLYSDLKKSGIHIQLNHHQDEETQNSSFRVSHSDVVLKTSAHIQSIRNDVTLTKETIRVRVEFRILAPIYIPNTSQMIPPTNNKDQLKRYIEYVLQRTNENINAYGAEFDNADFLHHTLFSVKKNRSKQNAIKHQLIYLKHLLLLVRPNVEIFVEDFERDVVYEPFFEGMNSREFFSTLNRLKSRSNNFLSMLDQVRDLVDPFVKTLPHGRPATNPLRKTCIWVVEFPSVLQKLEGYGTFPWDPRAGSAYDGIVLNAGNMQWDPRMMEDAEFASFKTIAHELCHTIGGLPHTFENNDMISDVPLQKRASVGRNFQLMDWPQTHGEYHCLFDLMDYEVDDEMQGLTHDQGILLRKTLTSHPLRQQLTVRVPTPSNSPWIAPLQFNHYIPDEVLNWDLEKLLADVDVHGRTSFSYNPYQQHSLLETSFGREGEEKKSRNWTHSFDKRVKSKEPTSMYEQNSAFRMHSQDNNEKSGIQTDIQSTINKTSMTNKEPPKQETNKLKKQNWIEIILRGLKQWKKRSCSSVSMD